MTAQLVITSFNGKTSLSVEYFTAPKIEATLGKRIETVQLSPAEADFSINVLTRLYDAKALDAQRRVG